MGDGIQADETCELTRAPSLPTLPSSPLCPASPWRRSDQRSETYSFLEKAHFFLAKCWRQVLTYLLSLDSSGSGSTALTRHASSSLVSSVTNGSNNTRLSLNAHVQVVLALPPFGNCSFSSCVHPSMASTLPCHHQHRGVQ